MNRKIIGAFLLLGSLFQGGCASTDKDLRSYTIEDVVPGSLRLRRPAGESADPDAGPGGEDYQSAKLPDRRGDCRTIDETLSTVELSPILECFKSINTVQTVVYELERSYQPALILVENPGSPPPDCLKRTLPTLPVPREVVFKVQEGEKEGCYSTRIEVEKGKMLDVQHSEHRWTLNLETAEDFGATNANELKRTLAAWMLTPLFRPSAESPQAPSRVLPEYLCAKCFADIEK